MIKLIYWLKKTLNLIPNSNELNGKKIAFTTLRILPFPIHQEFFIANILARKGALVYVILDNGLYKHWDTYQKHHNNKKINPILNWYFSIKSIKIVLKCKLFIFLYRHKNIKVVYTKSFVNINEIDNVILSNDDISNSISSVRRYTECGFYDEKNNEHYNYYLKCIYNTKISKLIAYYLVDELKIDKLITSHGIYSLWGPIFTETSNNNIPSFIYGAHAYRDDEVLYTSTYAQTLSKDVTWEKFDKIELTDKQINKVDTYFKSRIRFKSKDTNIYYGGIKTFEEIIIPKKTDDIMNIVLFPNIIWDGDIVQRDTYFNGVLDWVIKTIKFAETSEHNFIIRFHPAENTLFSDSPRLKDAILEKYPTINEFKNIFLIDSDMKINTYQFIEKNIDLGIVYDGILALEMTFMEIPVISPSINRFSSGKFIISPSNIEDYFSYLSDRNRISDFFQNRESIEKDLKKYAYWFLFEAGYFFPIYDKLDFGKIVYNSNTIDHINSPRFKRFEIRLFEFK